jgi:hypothetical protein
MFQLAEGTLFNSDGCLVGDHPNSRALQVSDMILFKL